MEAASPNFLGVSILRHRQSPYSAEEAIYLSLDLMGSFTVAISNQRRFAPTPAHITRNTHSSANWTWMVDL